MCLTAGRFATGLLRQVRHLAGYSPRADVYPKPVKEGPTAIPTHPPDKGR